MLDTTRGSARVRAWPKPRGENRHPTNRFWSDWLVAANYLYRYQPAKVQAALQEATRGTPWMPRDVFISATRGRAFMWSDEEGHRYYPMPYKASVSYSLDALGQTEGYMLYRGTDIWLPIEPASADGQLLTWTAGAPSWEAPATMPSEKIVPILSGATGATTYNVNSTSYGNRKELQLQQDLAEWTPTHFRLVLWANSSEAAQTVTAQLIRGAVNTDTVHTGGNDVTISNTNQRYDSGWRTADTPGANLQEWRIALKGSNGTVDLVANVIFILLKG